MSLKPYPEYKESGVESLGKVPIEWDVVSVSRFITFQNGADYKHVEVSDGGYPVFGSGGEFRRASEYLFDGESVLFGRKGTVDKPLYVNGKFWTVDTMYYTHIDTRYLLPKFLYYWALRIPFDFYLTNTALPSMTQTDLGAAKIALPTPFVQEEIVQYLNRETTEIDAFIADQERLIELLDERRAATITHAVTKGLDPNVPMKETGLEWAPLIPQHWKINKISRSFRASKGQNAAALTHEYCASIPGPYPVYSGQTEDSGVMALIDEYEFDAGKTGVLFTTTVGSEKVMSVRHLYGKFSLSQNCMIIFPVKELVIRYYYYQFQTLFEYEKGNIPQHMQASFRMSDLNQYRYLQPPSQEEHQIADYLDREMEELDAAVCDAREAIALSRERRAALISAAVTGQLDVSQAHSRGAAAEMLEDEVRV